MTDLNFISEKILVSEIKLFNFSEIDLPAIESFAFWIPFDMQLNFFAKIQLWIKTRANLSIFKKKKQLHWTSWFEIDDMHLTIKSLNHRLNVSKCWNEQFEKKRQKSANTFFL